ncbi:MAG: HAD family hydrolase [Planctomycetaceae bacterium]|nr:HAD family hydrolase [Planctomycetaceae bacterium]
MTDAINEIIAELSHPLEAIDTATSPRIHVLDEIKAVLFDIYGTLLISGSGDIGAHAETVPAKALIAAMQAVGLPVLPDPEHGVAVLHETILAHQERHRLEDIQYPEIDILAVWRDVLNRYCEEGWSDVVLTPILCEQLAVEYECRVNPVWPMPGITETIRKMAETGRELGLISNAQFFTPLLFPVLCDASLDDLGFRDDLRFYSYRYLRAKPGEYLYQQAADTLDTLGISPAQTLYVGNDMLKDIWPASTIGFKTALFAGDARSLRCREGDDRVREVHPDLVVTDLRQLLTALGVG